MQDDPPQLLEPDQGVGDLLLTVGSGRPGMLPRPSGSELPLGVLHPEASRRLLLTCPVAC